MKKYLIFEDRKLRNILLLFLIIFLFILTNDFGISYDEFWYRDNGFIVLSFIGEIFAPEKILEIKNTKDLQYPSIQEILSRAPIGFKIQHTVYSAIEFIFFEGAEKKVVFLMRHYLNILMSSLLFITCYKIFRLKFDKYISLIGFSLIVLSPKMFPDFYYNPNDIWAFFAASLTSYCTLYFLKTNKIKYIYILSFLFAFAINTRLIFFYLYFLFILFFFIKNNFNLHKENLIKLFKQFILFIFILFLLTPQMWIDYFGIINLFIQQLSFPENPMILFNGEFQRTYELSWYFTFFWIFASTPILYLLFLFIGFLSYIKLFFDNNKFSKKELTDNFFLLYLLIPIVALIVFKPNLYNGWRHFYFLNLGFAYFCLLGIKFFFTKIKSKKLFITFNILIFLNFFNIILWMYKNHPYQNVFFNVLFKNVSEKYEMDYWGLSNTEALGFIIEDSKYHKGNVSIKAIGENRIIYAYKLLDNNIKNKIKILKRDSLTNADYYITTFGDGKNKDYYISSGYSILNEIKVDNFPINLVLKKR